MAPHPAPETVHLMVGPWDHEGIRRVHRPGGLHASCRRPPQHRWDALPGVLRSLPDAAMDNGFGADGRVEVFTLGREPLAPRAGLAAAGRERARRSTCAPAAALSLDAARPASEPPDALPLRPARPGAGDRRRATAGRSARRSATAARLDGRADILRYVGDPLAERPRADRPACAAELYASTSAVDTDFTVTLCDVFADGTVNTDPGRHRPRPVPRRPRRARRRSSRGAVVRYAVDLYATSYVVARGPPLRVDVSSSNFDRYDRNPNTGRAATGRPRPSRSRHDRRSTTRRAHPSHVLLPVRQPG